MCNKLIDMVMKRTLGEVLKSLREHRGLSQNKLAQLSGVSRTYIILIENGEREGRTSMDVIQKLAKALDVPANVFLEDTKVEIPSKPFTSILDEVQERYHALELTEIPRIGAVPAGTPFEVEQQPQDYIKVPKELLKGITHPERLYALEVVGDSLMGDEIYNGYHVIVQPMNSSDIINGKIYIVRLHGKETCARHVYKENDYLRLVSSNGEYKEIEAKEGELLGRIVLSGHWKKH